MGIYFRSEAALFPNYFGQTCSLIGSRTWAFDRYQNQWPEVTLNDLMAVITRYCVISHNTAALGANCVKFTNTEPILATSPLNL